MLVTGEQGKIRYISWPQEAQMQAGTSSSERPPCLSLRPPQPVLQLLTSEDYRVEAIVNMVIAVSNEQK